MSALSDLFSLKGLISLAITIPFVIGALIKLRLRAGRVDIRRDSQTVQGVGHTLVAGGARNSTVIGGQGHAVSITQQLVGDALRPGEGLALGFWGYVCLIGLCVIVLFVPYAADIVVLTELLACFALPALALWAVFDLRNVGERVGPVVIYFIFTVLISWVVLRNYSSAAVAPSYVGLGFLPTYAPSFHVSFSALFLGGPPIGNDLLNALIVASSAFGLAMLVVVHTQIGLSYLAQDRGITYATQAGLRSLLGAVFATLWASGFGVAIWHSLASWDGHLMLQFFWAMIAQTFSFP